MEKLLKKTDGDFDKLFKCFRGQHPPILKMYMAKKITLETMCILETILNYIKSLDNNIAETYIWPTVKQKILKYRPFVKFDMVRMKLELRKILT